MLSEFLSEQKALPLQPKLGKNKPKIVQISVLYIILKNFGGE